MKKIVLVFGMMVCASIVKAQGDSLIISWLPTNQTQTTALGYNSPTIAAAMEFYAEDFFNYNSTNKVIIGIKQVQFYLDSADLSFVTGCNVLIMQGKDIYSATEVVREAVPVSDLVKHWNLVNLPSIYNIDLSQRLYIAYEVSISKQAYPLGATSGSTVKQGWFRTGTNAFINIATTYQRVFLIKALAIVESVPNEMSATLNLTRYNVKGDSLTVRGTVKNLGKTPLTSFKLSYTVDGVQSATDTFSKLNIAANGSYNFVHTQKYVAETAKLVTFTVQASEPNGVKDMIKNPSVQEVGVIVCENKVQRMVLHEVFTSSTCTPCNPGNTTLSGVLNAKDTNKWVCIKYQYNFPSTGDPYYTAECGNRGTFYGGIGGVPTLFGDGQFSDNPNSYTSTKFDNLANIPAAATTMVGSVTANETNKTIAFNVTINPATNYNNPNMRFFAAVVEKRTVKNATSNGETDFFYVMKKFLTSVSGDTISPFVLNTPITRNYTYTFKGDYRLPTNGQPANIINHTKENSIEDFQDLAVIYWLQDIITKEVYQAGKADPNPGYASPVSVAEIPFGSANMIYPNPAKDNLTILTADPIKEISIHNILGQKVGFYTGNVTTVPVSDLVKGIYIITVKTEKGITNQKFVKE